ncbi:MAG: glycoside hydrolase family 97 C-terminal domain-containing protein, partial [Alistipes sp.]|nr:glycoside hydrolase family 97 C-terminal domain-containing protein [Alistipes sp.]
PTKYLENHESFAFLKHVPTVWDEPRPLFGTVGSNVGVARRSGDMWFVGVMGGSEAQSLAVDLSFLGGGVWEMTQWADGANAATNGKDCRRSALRVTAADRIPVALAPGGGFAAVIRRESGAE